MSSNTKQKTKWIVVRSMHRSIDFRVDKDTIINRDVFIRLEKNPNTKMMRVITRVGDKEFCEYLTS